MRGISIYSAGSDVGLDSSTFVILYWYVSYIHKADKTCVDKNKVDDGLLDLWDEFISCNKGSGQWLQSKLFQSNIQRPIYEQAVLQCLIIPQAERHMSIAVTHFTIQVLKYFMFKVFGEEVGLCGTKWEWGGDDGVQGDAILP